MTINEALSYIKLLKQRHVELCNLRDVNKSERLRMFRETETVEKPAYNVQKIDKMAMTVAREIRILDAAIKKANAITEIVYAENPEVFKEIE